MEQLLTVRQVAKLLAISKSTVYKWIREERLPVINLRRNGARRILRIEHWALKEYIKKGKEAT